MTVARRTKGRLVSATDLARYCDVDLKTIHNWANRGKIPGTRTAGRHLRFRRMDVVDFLRTYELPLPDALKTAAVRVAVLDGAAGDLAPMRRVLARRFEVVAFDDPVEGLLSLGTFDPDVVVIGDVSPLEARAVIASLRTTPATRSTRVVSLGEPVRGAAASAPRGDATQLAQIIERVAGTV
ncbi:MAG: helix-turn-helix domain-containing protein [Polyangiaceae bacterium]